VGGPAGMSQAALFIPLSIFLAALASPTDPTATLAVVHQYRAKGEVADTIMGVAAFDDVFGIVNYSLGVGIAGAIISHGSFAVETSLLVPLARISGGVALGAAFGFALNLATRLAKRETEGELIVLIFAALALCFGAARLCHVDELLATMAMGCIVANFNAQQETVFGLLERYTEELIFVFFFTLSGMQLSFSILGEVYGLVLLFVFLRATGKVAGTALGGLASNASSQVRKFVPLGLLPQGGIVIGLALLMKSKPEFASIADVVVGIVIGATVIHEILGPIASEGALKLAGETHESDGARVDSRRTGR
jgi:NhaP-type Na+/H+ or K+/H+ antiporter